MHIPDGMLSGATLAATGAASAGFVGYALHWVNRHVDPRRVVLMAVLAALVFALQMLNFPVAGGTSGHFAGGAAVAILVGPWAAVLVMTSVLVVQAVVFADGGFLALGANVLNMAVLGPFIGYALWLAARRLGRGRAVRVVGAFVGAWSACVVGALAAALEIALSGNADLRLILGAMGFWHALIGLGEGLITGGLIAYVSATRPDLMERSARVEASYVRGVAATLGLLALALAGLSFLASTRPDGLEYVYTAQGVGRPFPAQHTLESPLPDYLVPGLSNETLAGILAGLVGVVVTGLLLYSLVGSARRRRHSAEERP